MSVQRRLLHCSRCLRVEAVNAVQPPTSSQPEQTSPLDASLPSETPRVSLSADSMRKVPARDWTRQSSAATGNRSKNPLAKDQLRREQREVTAKFYTNTAKEKLKKALTQAKVQLPPIPAPHAVHCIITPVPKSFTMNDVKRLVKFDKTKQTEHPLAEATRIYGNNLHEQPSYLLRFSHPSHLQDFLTRVPEIKLFGDHISAKLFQGDLAKSHLRPGTVLPHGSTPINILRHRVEYFRDFSGKSNLVMVSGFPAHATLGTITYWAANTLEKEKFQWAYEWKNRPGKGNKFEPNIVPVGAGRINKIDSELARWVFMLKDKESAWRFARGVHLTYFREERWGQDFLMKARVIE